MDGNRFDRMVTRLVASGSRRGLLALLALVAGGFTALTAAESQAGKGTGGRKGGKRHGRNRPRRRHARRRKHKKHKKHKKKDQPQEECSPQMPDGPCAANQLCVEGACQACDVICDGDPADCGAALRAALDAAPSGPLYVCPGRYAGPYVITAGIALIGAGDGDDPSVDSILDGLGTSRVLGIGPGEGEVRLEGLRLTGGNEGTSGGGISSNNNRDLTLRRCTVSENHAAVAGGGIFNPNGTLTLDDCRIENNTAAEWGGGILSGGTFSGGSTTLTGNTLVRGNEAVLQGGGIFVRSDDVTIEAGCQVTVNMAPAGQGGGIYRDVLAGTVDLANDQIVTDNTGGNCAGQQIDNCDG